MERLIRRTALLCVGIAATIGAVGCQVLTPDQVKAVEQFAASTQNYGTTPAAVYETYADVRLEKGVLTAASRTSPDSVETQVQGAVDQRLEVQREVAGARQAMVILDKYAAMLQILSAETFTTDLQNSAKDLASSIDKDVAIFNQLTSKNVSGFGDIIAGVVRGIGGIAIKHQQHKAIKEAVTAADTPIKTLTAAIVDSMAKFSGESGHFASTRTDIGQALRAVSAANSPRTVPVEYVARAAGSLLATAEGGQLATQASQAALAYSDAHTKLKEALQGTGNLKSALAQIEVMVREVEAAKRLRDSLKKGE